MIFFNIKREVSGSNILTKAGARKKHWPLLLKVNEQLNTRAKSPPELGGDAFFDISLGLIGVFLSKIIVLWN